MPSLYGSADARSIDDMVKGLFAPARSIASKYFYDATGSQLFEEICRLPEYHVTRTEMALLRHCAEEIAAGLKPGSTLVEFGSGASVKTVHLLNAAPQIGAYVPIDISPAALHSASQDLRGMFPELIVEPIVADFTRVVALPSTLGNGPNVGFFPGSTIGNFDPDEACRFLAQARSLLGEGARFILGADITRDPALLVPAYDDEAGVTAAFNLNLLTRINREVGADFDLSSFRHRAVWNAQKGRVEMHLVSNRAQVVHLPDRQLIFAEGEAIHTENSYKYTRAGLETIALAAGWHVTAGWEGQDPFPPQAGRDEARFCILMLDAQQGDD